MGKSIYGKYTSQHEPFIILLALYWSIRISGTCSTWSNGSEK